MVPQPVACNPSNLRFRGKMAVASASLAIPEGRAICILNQTILGSDKNGEQTPPRLAPRVMKPTILRTPAVGAVARSSYRQRDSEARNSGEQRGKALLAN